MSGDRPWGAMCDRPWGAMWPIYRVLCVLSIVGGSWWRKVWVDA